MACALVVEARRLSLIAMPLDRPVKAKTSWAPVNLKRFQSQGHKILFDVRKKNSLLVLK
jgi:hypothetical protein